MTAPPEAGTPPGLRAGALGFAEAVIMGIAGSGPAYSVAASTAVLVGAVGVLAPASLFYCGLVMLGIVLAFRHLNRVVVNAGASYAWVAAIFSPALGFFAGWAQIVSSTVFMVSGTLPAAAATLKLLAPSLADSQGAVTLTAALWLVGIGAVVAKGIKLSSYVQIGFTLVEVGVLALFFIVAAMGFAPPPVQIVAAGWFTGVGFTPALFASGAATALFALSGWDVTANLNEETRDGARIAGVGSIVAVGIVVLLLVGFNALALRLLSNAEIDRAGINIVSAVAQKLMPYPWDYLAVVAVMVSTIGTLETSILQFTRTLYSMSRDQVLHPRYGRLHPVYRTPWVATLLITALGLALLLGSSYLNGIKTVINASVNAVGFQVAFYYGLAGLACAWYFRTEALTGIGKFVFLLAWPLLGVGFCFGIAVYSLPNFDLTTNILGAGSIAIGIVPYLWGRLTIPGRIQQST
ncbi:MAG TPA: APC family permease [Stellaceae bacterium]|jgi:amino acid transporter